MSRPKSFLKKSARVGAPVDGWSTWSAGSNAKSDAENKPPYAPNVCLLPSAEAEAGCERVTTIGRQLNTKATKELTSARHHLMNASKDDVERLRASLSDPTHTVEARFGQKREITVSGTEAQRASFCSLWAALGGFECSTSNDGAVVLTISTRLADRLLAQLEDPRTFERDTTAALASAKACPPPAPVARCGAMTKQRAQSTPAPRDEKVEPNERAVKRCESGIEPRLAKDQLAATVAVPAGAAAELDFWTEGELNIRGYVRGWRV